MKCDATSELVFSLYDNCLRTDGVRVVVRHDMLGIGVQALVIFAAFIPGLTREWIESLEAKIKSLHGVPLSELDSGVAAKIRLITAVEKGLVAPEIREVM